MNPKALLRPFIDLARRIRYGRFQTMRVPTRGMLRTHVYEQFYKSVSQTKDLDIVEIGAAAGAGTVAMAWALKDYKRKGKLISVEKCEGGSRSDYGGYEENYQVLLKNLKHFGVDEQVKLFPNYLTFENKSELLALVETEQIAGFVHDADGRVDRDFAILWPLLVDEGLIVIDDYAETLKFRPISEKSPDGGTKELTTFRLTNQFVEWGILKIDFILDHTVFAHKPANADFSRFDLEVCEDIVKGIMYERKEQFSD